MKLSENQVKKMGHHQKLYSKSDHHVSGIGSQLAPDGIYAAAVFGNRLHQTPSLTVLPNDFRAETVVLPVMLFLDKHDSDHRCQQLITSVSILHADFGAQVGKRREVIPPDAFNFGPLPAPQPALTRPLFNNPPKHTSEHIPHPPAIQTRRVRCVTEGPL
ncbi:hypothetical protein FRC03_010639 [Tulasnella sp. 419]|nr:hypothetical protein FRC03_010639 [Tulasnella sp. 419]